MPQEIFVVGDWVLMPVSKRPGTIVSIDVDMPYNAPTLCRYWIKLDYDETLWVVSLGIERAPAADGGGAAQWL